MASFKQVLALLTVTVLLMAGAPAIARGSQAPVASPSSSAEAYFQFLLGRHLEGDGQIEKAIAAFQRAAALDPKTADIPAEMAGLYARQGRVKEAIAAADAALTLDPANVDAHRVLGSIYAKMAEPDEANRSPAGDAVSAAHKAIDHLEKAHRSDDTDRDVGLDLALSRLYLQVDENQKAADLLNRVIEYEPDAGEAYVLLAHAETALGHPDRAVGPLEAASRSNPRLLQTLAMLYESQLKWADAARTYEHLLAFNPTSADTKTKWATALLQLNDMASANQARELLIQVNAALPTDPRPLYLLSAAERKRQDYPAAEAAARRLIALDPEGSSGPFALAQAYEDERRFDKAADVLEPVIARLDTPGRSGGRDLLPLIAHLGFAQLQAGRGDAAVKTFTRARELAPGSSFDASLIQAYIVAKQYDKAADMARDARLAQPDEPRFTELEARALALGGRKDRAVTLMQDAADAHPKDLGLQLSLVQTLEDAGRSAEADSTLRQVADEFPSDVRVSFQQGALLEKRKDYAHAEIAFREALAKDPDHAPTLNYLGYMLAERGERLDEAVALVQQALKLDPDNGSYLDSLGWAYVQQKKYDRAEPLLQRAAVQLPANSVVQEHLGDLLWVMGRHEDAVAAWQRALNGDREAVDVKALEKKIAKGR